MFEERRVLLDAFCGAGGAARGYQEAGFWVVGVDHLPQPNYIGDEFFQIDALRFLDDLLSTELWVGDNPVYRVETIHASPPCPANSTLNGWSGDSNEPDLIPEVRERVEETGLPYVIENVEGAPLRNPYRICGQGLGLKVRRHRLFETNFPMMGIPCYHHEPPVIVVGGSIGRKVFDPRRRAIAPTLEEAKEVMEIPWAVTATEVKNAIPPRYTEHIGGYLMTHLTTKAPVFGGREAEAR